MVAGGERNRRRRIGKNRGKRDSREEAEVTVGRWLRYERRERAEVTAERDGEGGGKPELGKTEARVVSADLFNFARRIRKSIAQNSILAAKMALMNLARRKSLCSSRKTHSGGQNFGI
ncbi:hypothetical protein L3X38_033450 [Prunus dulcis]|uniref:Uncharacterized protein n=1 Tax=Prunus dulcis TaxID=3755 RepID=A0AAD4VIC5_PRUDU|nr:hypothetical protein L3X38_033450 [Prunus dulcis]